jgi:SulP family sulfate permease
MAAPAGFVLVLSGMSAAVRTALMRGGLEIGGNPHVRFETDLDHGLEWCENRLLNDVAPQVIGNERVPVVELMVDVVKDRPLAKALLPYLERIEVAPGHRLIEQDTPSDDIFFVEQGRAASNSKRQATPRYASP